MMDQSHKHLFIERIMSLLRLLEENGLEFDHSCCDIPLFHQLSPEERQNVQAALESIRFMDEIPGGFFIYYAGGDERIIYANQGVLRIFQCETLREFRELTGNSFKGLVHPDDLEEVEESILRQIIENQYDLDYVQYRIRCKDGSIRWVEDYGHFVHRAAGGDIFYVFIADPSDERNQRQLEQKRVLTEALERADLAVKAKNTFLSHISHEMRTPLNAVFGFTTLAKTALYDDPDSAMEYLNEVEKASHQLLNMITEALDVSAMSTAAGAAEEECDLLDMMQEIYDFLLPQAQEKRIAFALDCGAVTHRGIYADRKRLRQLVLSLANNAITYTNPGGKVAITLEEKEPLPGSYAVYHLKVRDNGIGIKPEFLESAFEAFSRDRSSSLSGVRGIGLGLTIARNIVTSMKGSIDVESTPGQGSTFTVSLPFRVQPLPDADADGMPSTPSLRILLAEDNEINREIETELLQRMGFVVDPVSDGREALDRMEHASPGDYDLLIIDLQMPVMDGWEVASAIRKLPDPVLARVPIIALSANVSIHDRRRSLDCGINVHLPKPMNLNVLLETIERITKKPINS